MGKSDPAADAKARAAAAVAAAEAAKNPPEQKDEPVVGHVPVPDAPLVGEQGPEAAKNPPDADYGKGSYGDPGGQAGEATITARSNQNLSLNGEFLTPDTVYTLPMTSEVLDAIAVGALTVVDDEDAPDEE